MWESSTRNYTTKNGIDLIANKGWRDNSAEGENTVLSEGIVFQMWTSRTVNWTLTSVQKVFLKVSSGPVCWRCPKERSQVNRNRIFKITSQWGRWDANCCNVAMLWHHARNRYSPNSATEKLKVRLSRRFLTGLDEDVNRWCLGVFAELQKLQS